MAEANRNATAAVVSGHLQPGHEPIFRVVARRGQAAIASTNTMSVTMTGSDESGWYRVTGLTYKGKGEAGWSARSVTLGIDDTGWIHAGSWQSAVESALSGGITLDVTFDYAGYTKGQTATHTIGGSNAFTFGTAAEVRQIGLNSARGASAIPDEPNQKVIAVEDSYGGDADYDDWWWEVTTEKMDAHFFTDTQINYEFEIAPHEEFGGIVAASSEVGFVVEAARILEDGQHTALGTFGRILYSIELDGDGEILAVSGPTGVMWTITGQTASGEVNGPLNGTNFDVDVTFGVFSPGKVAITLDAQLEHQALTHTFSQSSKTLSTGRKIQAPANPGPVVTPTRIYHILDASAVNGQGHSAAIIPDIQGCRYYSYSSDGAVTVMHFNNINDALAAAKAAGYTHMQFWEGIDEQEASSARAAAEAFDGTDYDVGIRNCWHMVFAALKDAGTNATDSRSAPNQSYNVNVELASHSGKIP